MRGVRGSIRIGMNAGHEGVEDYNNYGVDENSVEDNNENN